ncbi:hypothetical protein ACVWZA_001480 [Sphingomonas sp. UYAg733]
MADLQDRAADCPAQGTSGAFSPCRLRPPPDKAELI